MTGKPKLDCGVQNGKAVSVPRMSYVNPEDPILRRLAIGVVEAFSGQPHLQRLYGEHRANAGPDDSFWEEAVKKLKLTIDGDLSRLGLVPRQGPLVVIANHPFGVVDGLLASYLIGLVRPDFKLMAHEAIGRAPEVRPNLLPIAFDGTRRARLLNITSCRQALTHLKSGGTLVIFPAGRVSTALHIFDKATDAPWKGFVATLIASAQPSVLPLYFEGQNGWLFHASSKFGESAREALLMREVTRRIGARISVRIGTPLAFEALAVFSERQRLLDHLRAVTYGLAREEAGEGDGQEGGHEGGYDELVEGYGLT